MKSHIAVLFACLGLVACSQKVIEPNFCQLPPGFRTWGGTEIRLQGFVVGEPHHGFALASEKCNRGAVLSWDDDSLDGSRLNHFLEHENDTGIIRIDGTGQITTHDGEIGHMGLPRGPTFKVSKLHSINVETMSFEGRQQFFNRWVLRGRALNQRRSVSPNQHYPKAAPSPPPPSAD